MGWKGLLLSNPSAVKARQMYEEELQLGDTVHCRCAYVSFDDASSAQSLTSLLEARRVHPSKFDMLIIDIDGADYYVLENLLNDGRYRPRLVVIEFNPTVGNDVVYIQERDVTVQRGSSLRAMAELALRHNYLLVCTTTFNAFLVDIACLDPDASPGGGGEGQEEEERGGPLDAFMANTPPARKLVRMLRALQSRGEGEGEGEEDEHVDIESIVTGSRSGALHDLLYSLRPSPSMETQMAQTYDGNCCTLAR